MSNNEFWRTDSGGICSQAPGHRGAPRALVLQMPAWPPQWWGRGTHLLLLPSVNQKQGSGIKRRASLIELSNPATFKGHFETYLVLVFCFRGFPCGSAGRESACNAGDPGLTPGLGRSPGEGKGYPLQYSGLENPMDCIVCGGCKELDTMKFCFTVYF